MRLRRRRSFFRRVASSSSRKSAAHLSTVCVQIVRCMSRMRRRCSPDRHGQCLDEAPLDLSDVVGIDLQGLGQFDGRTGHFAQYQYARIVGLGGYVLLGHEVHAVAQGCDERHVGDTVHGGQLLEGEAVVEVAHRRPVHRGVLAVDRADLLVDARLQFGVASHVVARGTITMAKVTCPRYSGWCSRNAAKPQSRWRMPLL